MDEIPDNSRFIYVICQVGAEAAARKEVLALPGLKLAFSLPGFLTFKVEKGALPEKFSLPTTLSRSYGWCLGKLQGEDANELISKICQQDVLHECSHIHVFQRETLEPGTDGFEPGISLLAREVAGLFEKQTLSLANRPIINRVAKDHQKVFDVVLVEPDQWWFGYHWTVTRSSRWPGGVPQFDTGDAKVSRAYFKLQEAILWSGIRIHPGDWCAEIGSSPGGACQRLLEQGARVIAIDPAELDTEIASHPNLVYLRRRGHEVKKRDFKDVKWLLADLNIAPKYTLDTVRDIVGHESVHVRGLILTLKMTEWSEVDKVPEYLAAVKAMGFQVVKARQLAFNRKEFCLVAARDKFMLRSGKKRKSQKI